MKKKLAFLFTLLAVTMVMAVSVFAATEVASGSCGVSPNYDSVKWTLDSEGTLTISGEGEMDRWAFNGNDDIKKVVINEGVTSIGWRAFYDCANLSSTTIPASVTSIDERAFENCESLSKVTFATGSKLESIGVYAFFDCESLSSITIPASVVSIGNEAFRFCDSLSTVTFETGSILESIGSYAFLGCGDLKTITFPSNLESIGESAFIGCENLIKVTLNKGLKAIGDEAFNGCGSIKTITLPSTLTTIGENAFGGCALTEIIIPKNVSFIGEGAFRECPIDTISVSSYNKNYNSKNSCNAIIETSTGKLISGTNTTVIPDDVTAIGSYAFCEQNEITEITIPSSVTTICDYAFYSCDNIKKVSFGKGSKLESIGVDAFASCGSLSSITIPSGVTSIGDSAFYSCRSLSSIIIPSGVTSIGDYVFGWCSGLKTVTIPNSVTDIEINAFERCKSIEKVIYKGTEDEWNEILISSGNDYLEDAEREYVKPDIVITKQPADVSGTSGYKTISIKAEGSGLKYTWQYRKSSSGTWTTFKSNSTATSISVPVKEDRNGYQYRCIVKDSNGTKLTSDVATIKYESVLNITKQPADIEASGGRGTIKVTAEGSGLTYKWYYRTPEEGKWRTISSTKSSISVPVREDRDGYEYRCKVTNSEGRYKYTDIVEIIYVSPIKITKQPNDVYGRGVQKNEHRSRGKRT